MNRDTHPGSITQAEVVFGFAAEYATVPLELRADDEYYDDEDEFTLTPEGDSADMPDSFYQDWEEEWANNTFAGVHISDETKAQLFTVLNGRGGYLMLNGQLKAHKAGKLFMSAEVFDRTQMKVAFQLREIKELLRGDIAAFPRQEQGAITDRMLAAIGAQYSGEHNRKARILEKKRLSKVGGATLRQAS